MTMYVCDGDAVLLIKIINAATIVLAAVVIAWTRHGEPEDTNMIHVLGIPIIQHSYFDGNYMAAVQLDDPLTDAEKQALRDCLSAGLAPSDRNMAERGITRATWRRMRYELVDVLHVADRRDDNGIQINTDIYQYLGMER